MELTVSGEAFRGILKDSRFGQKLGKGYIRDATVDLSFDGKELRISVLTLDAKIPAAGAWEGVVQLPLKSWKVLQKVPPSKDELVLRFDESTSKLSIGTTGFKAVWVMLAAEQVSAARALIERIDAELPWVLEAGRTAVMSDAKQGLYELFNVVSADVILPEDVRAKLKEMVGHAKSCIVGGESPASRALNCYAMLIDTQKYLSSLVYEAQRQVLLKKATSEQIRLLF